MRQISAKWNGGKIVYCRRKRSTVNNKEQNAAEGSNWVSIMRMIKDNVLGRGNYRRVSVRGWKRSDYCSRALIGLGLLSKSQGYYMKWVCAHSAMQSPSAAQLVGGSGPAQAWGHCSPDFMDSWGFVMLCRTEGLAGFHLCPFCGWWAGGELVDAGEKCYSWCWPKPFPSSLSSQNQQCRAGGPTGQGHEWFELWLPLRNSEMLRQRKGKEAELRELRLRACPAVLVCRAGELWAGMGKWQGLSLVSDYKCHCKPGWKSNLYSSIQSPTVPCKPPASSWVTVLLHHWFLWNPCPIIDNVEWGSAKLMMFSRTNVRAFKQLGL